ncbi:MAG: metallophosphatase family protein [Coprobacillus sp.]|nr:metallophosphatase family protein [Coprobacillus sp.]
MKIVVVSDTHHVSDFVDKIPGLEKADLYLHAGDSGMPEPYLYPFRSVMGNCDFDDHDMYLTEYCPLGKILMKHTPFTESEIRKYKENGYVIFIHGHTHVRKFEERDGVYIINPGSLYFPRDGLEGCYLVLEVSETELKYEFKPYFD